MATWTNEYRAEWYREQRSAAKADHTCGWCGESVAHMRKDARWCSKPCANAGVRRDRLERGIPAWRADSKGKFRYRCKSYGITPEDVDRMLDEQGGECAICHSEFSSDQSSFHIDHDHQTGAVRGLLCNNCNLGIGQLGDDVERLLAAAAYLLTSKNALASLALVEGGFA